MADRPRHWIVVPAGSKRSQCKGVGCTAQIYFVTSANGRPQPVNCDIEGGVHPSEVPADRSQISVFDDPGSGAPLAGGDGRGESHFADCVARKDFRRGIGA